MESPYSPARAANRPPFELVMVATMARGVIPIIPLGPINLLTIIPNTAPIINFVAVSTIPLVNGLPACLILI